MNKLVVPSEDRHGMQGFKPTAEKDLSPARAKKKGNEILAMQSAIASDSREFVMKALDAHFNQVRGEIDNKVKAVEERLRNEYEDRLANIAPSTRQPGTYIVVDEVKPVTRNWWQRLLYLMKGSDDRRSHQAHRPP